MDEYNNLCKFEESKDIYILKCNSGELVINRRGSISILKDGIPIWSTTKEIIDSEFSAVAFLTDSGYLSVKEVEYEKGEEKRYSFRLKDSNGDEIGLFVVSIRDDIFFLRLIPARDSIKRYGFSFALLDGVYHYGIGELTDENDIFRKLYHPTEQHFVLDYGSFERPYLQTDEGSDVITPVVFNSRGGFIFSDSYSYLDLSFNRGNNRIFKIHIVPEYGEHFFELAIYCGKNTKKAYEKWINTRWNVRPDLPLYSFPSDELIKKPIWTTWAIYKWSVDQQKVIDFADRILSFNLPISYLEIDDRWTARYGDLDFDEKKFPDAKGMIDYLHKRGIKVSLWVPPFVNTDAESFEEGVDKKAFIASYDSRYPALVGWWDTGNIENAGLIDFFSTSGRDWFGKKIDYLVERYKVDGFKYDAGEAQFLPKKPRLSKGLHPNMYSDYYARWGLLHKGVEMRSAYFSQNLPILFRQFDKASHWGFNNGLASVMTQILAMGIAGYPFVLPDMIGGNEYLNKASEELFVRWIQLNTFLPYMQFSIPPFREDYSKGVMGITLKYLAIREGIIPALLEGVRESSLTQLPLVRPLFFEFEDDSVCYSIEDEFMLTSRYLVAPIIKEGEIKRDIYIPGAKFRSIYDPNEVIEGPEWIRDYPAPIDKIPVFERITDGSSGR